MHAADGRQQKEGSAREMLQAKRWTVAVQLCIFMIASGSANAQDDSSPASRGSIIGFAVVLSFLVVSIFVVMLICSCYGLCKCPFKRSVARERQPHNRRGRPMIPLPSPGVMSPSMSSTFQHGQQISTVNHQQISKQQFGRKQLTSTVDGVRLQTQLPPSARYSAPPTASNVIHLSQLQSPSYHSDLEQIALGSVNPPSVGRQGGRTHTLNQPQRPELNLRARGQPSSSAPQTENNPIPPPHLPPLQVQPMDIPPPYPGMGYPYMPCKSPKTPHGVVHHSATNYPPHTSPSHSQLHNWQATTKQQASASRGAAGGGTGGESELTDIDSVTEGESNSVVSGHERFKDKTSSPPSYSTEV